MKEYSKREWKDLKTALWMNDAAYYHRITMAPD